MKDIFEQIKSEIVPTHPDIYRAVTEQLIFNSAKDKNDEVSVDDKVRGFFGSVIEDAGSGVKEKISQKTGSLAGLMDTSKWGDDEKLKGIEKDFFSLESLEKNKDIIN